MIKTDLSNHTSLGREEFPWPGVLKKRSLEDQAAILADPAAFFGAPVEVDTVIEYRDVIQTAPALDKNGDPRLDENGDPVFVQMVVGREPVWGKTLSDPCPEGARGFGWWPEVDQSPALGIGETYGAETLTVDIPNKRWLVTRAINPAPAGAVDAYFDGLEKSLHREIDMAAENRRLDFITPGAGQSATYDVKATEAEAIARGATPDVAVHPFVVKEAAALGKTATARAAEIVATQAAWFAIGSDIEAARQGAKAAVTQAKGNEATMRAAAVVDWSAIGGA